ncbi:hypothetical protein QUC31_013383 [Theobroma cacao]
MVRSSHLLISDSNSILACKALDTTQILLLSSEFPFKTSVLIPAQTVK